MKLDDKYTQETGSVYLTGMQALARLPVDQMRLDQRAGLNTASFISGYQGSPLGTYDLALARIKPLLRQHRIHFVSGVNEEIAATSVFGSQISHILGESKYDGVVGIWYGKGPGVDRSGDVFRHANLAGTGPNCAALALAGDDHTSKSSTIPHQSDFSFYNVGMPLFYPGNTQEILDYGLLAIALSRYSGAWSAMKMVTSICDAGGTVDVDPSRLDIRIPGGYRKVYDPWLMVPSTLALEHEVNQRRLEAAREFARQNSVNRLYGACDAWLGIATAGKSYYDLQQALRDVGIDRDALETLGIRIAKFGMTFPLEPVFTRDFARGLQTVLVIEEKRSFLELQIRDILYNLHQRPVVVGKQDDSGRPLFRSEADLAPEQIIKVLGSVLNPRVGGSREFGKMYERLRLISEIEARPKEVISVRGPNFCSGCPHNRSTVVLDGRVTGGGIGCHSIAGLLPESGRSYAFLTQMGGEGAPWIGMEPFVTREHIFQNIGDGTYFHSGQLSLQACVSAGVNITYKILYNGAVAMTGGQNASGTLAVGDLTRKLESEGVQRTVVLTDDPAKYHSGVRLAANAEVRHRDGLPEALGALEKIPGVTVIIYDQRCAAEQRRDRSRGKVETPILRLVINEEVCEGCGDCVRQSNCMSLYPVSTEFGPKTRIHQSSCNLDYSCALGDCPSFVSVKLKKGTGLKRKTLPQLSSLDLPPQRDRVRTGDYFGILSTGIGGTGVVTINALLATAAWIDGLSTVTLDQTGLAQKGGAVVSAIILSEHAIETSSKIGYANADLLLGFDLLGASNPDNLKAAHPARTAAVVNTAEIPTGEEVRGRTRLAGSGHAVDLINGCTDRAKNVFVDASRIAEGLFGSHMFVNMFLLGVAWQAGHIPVSLTALEEAIRLNGTEASRNLEAFLWGRKYFEDAQSVEDVLDDILFTRRKPLTPDERARELANYQNAEYAAQYRDFVQRVAARAPALEEPVARYLYKLMAYKDEYEVARLLSKRVFHDELRDMWEQVESVGYNLHPPILRSLGLRRKIKLGQWFGVPLRALAALKVLRRTPFDIFGYARIRRDERALIVWYKELIENCLRILTPENLHIALEIASLPDQIRGYESIKSESIARIKSLAADKLSHMSQVQVPVLQ